VVKGAVFVKYLVVQTRQIGDVLVSTALCDNLKKNDPAGDVHYLVMDYCAGMALGDPYIDKLIVIDKSQRNDWCYLWHLMMQLRQQRYDVIINSQGQMIGLLTCLFSGAKTRIGFDSFPWRLGHNRIIRFGRDTEHQGNCSLLDDRFALLKPLDLHHEDRNYHLWLSDIEQAKGRQTLFVAGVDLQRPLIALGVNSLGSYKRWPIDYFAQLAQWLIEQYDAQILVYAAPSERDYNRQLRQLLPPSLRSAVFDDIETASIRELAGLLRQCQMFVGNDTGPRHIAQALNIPLLTIVAPTGAKSIANPVNHPRFRAIDVWDVLGEQQKQQLLPTLHRDNNDQALFRQLTPQHIMPVLASLIGEQCRISHIDSITEHG
jgi:heptosyltransferase III